MSTSKSSIYLTYLIIPVFILILSVFPIELVFHLLGDQTTEDAQYFFIQFEGGSYKLHPNINFNAKYTSGPFHVYTDSIGLRCDAARKYAIKKGDTIDILFLGDSQGFGNGVNFEDTIVGHFAKLAKTDKIRVANASVGGHALRNQFQLARWLHDQQNLLVSQYVILLTPLMVTTACDKFTRALVGNDGRLYENKKNKIEMMVIWLKTHSMVYPIVRDAIRNIGYGVSPSGDVPFVFKIFDTNTNEEESIQKLATCLYEFRDFAAKNGATLSIVYEPLTFEMDFNSILQSGKAKGLKLDPNLPMRIFTGAAKKLGIPFYNLHPVLEKAHSQRQQLNLKGDFHYNKNISRKSAQYLYQKINK